MDVSVFLRILMGKKVGNLELPGLFELPTDSCDALILRAAHNSGFGYVPINEYIRDRQSILEKHNPNGLFYPVMMHQ